MKIPQNYNVYIFDLDNTLYRETDYLFPAFNQIGDYVFHKTGIKSSEIARYLQDEFISEGRKNLFDKLIEKFSLDKIAVQELLQVLRNAETGTIILYQDAYDTLLSLKNLNKKIAIITNGTVQQQKNKIAHIEWKELNGYIDFVFSDETERKPSPKSINLYLVSNRISHDEVVFVGDGIEDERAATSAGIKFIKSFFKG